MDPYDASRNDVKSDNVSGGPWAANIWDRCEQEHQGWRANHICLGGTQQGK